MDLKWIIPNEIKQEEPAEFYLISATQGEELNVAFDKYPTDVEIAEVPRTQIKQELPDNTELMSGWCIEDTVQKTYKKCVLQRVHETEFEEIDYYHRKVQFKNIANFKTIQYDTNLEVCNGQSQTSDSSQERKIRVGSKWAAMGTFHLSEMELNAIYQNGRLCNGFNDLIITKLNKFDDLSCVLVSNGPYRAKGQTFWTMRYFCKHDKCKRCYKVYQMASNVFRVYRNLEDIVHDSENPICRSMKGHKRLECKIKLKHQLPAKYLQECEDNADMKLVANGNLQDIISMSAAKKIRCEALSENDFHKDEIMDLFVMTLTESENEKQKKNDKDPGKVYGIESIRYVQRICLEPFILTLFTDDQFECLKLLCEDGKTVTIYFDAMGDAVKLVGKVIYYYAGVTRDTSIPLRKHEIRRLLPLFESVSGAHDSFNIGLVLREYKHQFHVKFPKLKWPIRKAVTHMNYALMNAICHSWNNINLIDYINLAYEAVNESLEWSTTLIEHHNIETNIQICSRHILKLFSKNVDESFPNLVPEQKKIIKNIFVGMFDVADLKKLRAMWLNFSTILLSRYTDDNVNFLLYELASTITSKEKIETDDVPDGDGEYCDDEDPGWKLPESDEHQSIYQRSRFYQDFKNVSFDKEDKDFEEMSGESQEKTVNPYHSPKFCEIFLQKYISILSLWTCSPRIKNTPAESHFKNTKKDAIAESVEIGSMPLKAGRFVRFLKKRVYSISQSILLGARR